MQSAISQPRIIHWLSLDRDFSKFIEFFFPHNHCHFIIRKKNGHGLRKHCLSAQQPKLIWIRINPSGAQQETENNDVAGCSGLETLSLWSVQTDTGDALSLAHCPCLLWLEWLKHFRTIWSHNMLMGNVSKHSIEANSASKLSQNDKGITTDLLLFSVFSSNRKLCSQLQHFHCFQCKLSAIKKISNKLAA